MVLALLFSYELFLWFVSFITELIGCFSKFFQYHQYQNSEQRVNPGNQFTKLLRPTFAKEKYMEVYGFLCDFPGLDVTLPYSGKDLVIVTDWNKVFRSNPFVMVQGL